MKSKPTDWSGLKIKRALEDAGYTQTDVARDTGKTPTAVHKVIWEGMVSDAIRTDIARRIGVDVKEIWPSYYLKDQDAA